jgi:hypothetical protein
MKIDVRKFFYENLCQYFFFKEKTTAPHPLEDYNEANKQQNRRFNCEPSKLKTKIIVFFTISLFKGTTV